MTHYEPIPCDLHDTYERYVMEKRKLRLDWHDEQGHRLRGVVEAKDLFTRDGVEYLSIRQPGGVPRDLRLDQIDAVEPV